MSSDSVNFFNSQILIVLSKFDIHSCCLAVGLTSLYITPFLWHMWLVLQIFWRTFLAFHCMNYVPKCLHLNYADQICGSVSSSFMHYVSSTICMFLRCWWQHYCCRWESATLFSLIFGSICYFGRLVNLFPILLVYQSLL